MDGKLLVEGADADPEDTLFNLGSPLDLSVLLELFEGGNFFVDGHNVIFDVRFESCLTFSLLSTIDREFLRRTSRKMIIAVTAIKPHTTPEITPGLASEVNAAGPGGNWGALVGPIVTGALDIVGMAEGLRDGFVDG